MKLSDICERLDRLAPRRLTAEGDNTGLIVGDADVEVGGAMLAVDLTDAVLDEAVRAGVQLVVCYHPPIYAPLSSLRADRAGPGRRVYRAIRAGLALYAAHTNLDAAAEGTNDALAEALGLESPRPLAAHQSAGGYKLVTFVPAETADAVAEALFAAGAGRIGQYSKCSFRAGGVGTFLGGAGTSPAVGQAGRFERADELRLETVVPSDRAAEAVAALRSAHPYEEVAFDLVPLAEIDERVGLGRVGRLAEPATLDELVGRIKRGLGVESVLLVRPRELPERIDVAACCAGSCGSLFRRAIDAGAGLYLTGEMRHHDALAAGEAGMAVVAVRHSVSERLVLGRIAGRIRDWGLDVRVSTVDADPFQFA